MISTNNYKNKAILRIGVEAKDAMALQPVETPGCIFRVILSRVWADSQKDQYLPRPAKASVNSVLNNFTLSMGAVFLSLLKDR